MISATTPFASRTLNGTYQVAADTLRRIDHDLYAHFTLFKTGIRIQFFKSVGGSLQPLASVTAVMVADIQLRLGVVYLLPCGICIPVSATRKCGSDG